MPTRETALLFHSSRLVGYVPWHSRQGSVLVHYEYLLDWFPGTIPRFPLNEHLAWPFCLRFSRIFLNLHIPSSFFSCSSMKLQMSLYLMISSSGTDDCLEFNSDGSSSNCPTGPCIPQLIWLSSFYERYRLSLRCLGKIA